MYNYMGAHYYDITTSAAALGLPSTMPQCVPRTKTSGPIPLDVYMYVLKEERKYLYLYIKGCMCPS